MIITNNFYIKFSKDIHVFLRANIDSIIAAQCAVYVIGFFSLPFQLPIKSNSPTPRHTNTRYDA